MDKLVTLKIFLKDSKKTSNKFNKDLFKFLDNNLTEIVDSGYYVRLILVDDTNIRKFIKLGIKNTPALLNESEDIVVSGVGKIIHYIVSKCEDRATETLEPVVNKKHVRFEDEPKQQHKNDNIRDYLLEQAMSKDDTMEDALDLNKVKEREDKYNKNRERLQSRNINTNRNTISTARQNAYINSNAINTSEEAKHINDTNEVTARTRSTSEMMNDDPELKNFWENLEETNY